MEKHFFAVSYYYNISDTYSRYFKLRNVCEKFKNILNYDKTSICLIDINATHKLVEDNFNRLSQKKDSVIVLFLLGQVTNNENIGEKRKSGKYETRQNLNDEKFKLYNGEFIIDNRLRKFRTKLHPSNTLYIFVNSCHAGGMHEMLVKSSPFEFLLEKVFRIPIRLKRQCKNIFIFNSDENSNSTDSDLLDLLLELPDNIIKTKPKNFNDIWNIINNINQEIKYLPINLIQTIKNKIKPL
ncbi:MAG: hypothetical protein PSX81_06670 [bacterium]|nr:hypothetical protein [bacterium]